MIFPQTPMMWATLEWFFDSLQQMNTPIWKTMISQGKQLQMVGYYLTLIPKSQRSLGYNPEQAPCQVVPPSYKLVYNPINYRYIYHKS